MERLAFTLFAVFAAVTLCSAQNPNETRVVKDASGRVKYTVQKTGDREIIKDSKGKVVGSTRQTKDRKYHYNSNGTSAGSETKRNQNGTRIIKDASGRVKYTVRENGQQEVIKDSKGHIAGRHVQRKTVNITTIQTARRQAPKPDGNRHADSGKAIIRQVLNRTTGSEWLREYRPSPKRLW